MSTANLIPETWGLTGDEAKDTLARVGRRRLIGDAFKRLRFSDGFSHARSMAFLGILLFVEGVIAVVGIASSLGSDRISRRDRTRPAGGRPGPGRAHPDPGGRPGTPGSLVRALAGDRLRHDRRPDHGHDDDGRRSSAP